jgi:hypothetical protein
VLCRFDGVVPVAVEVVAAEVQGGHLLVGDLDPRLVGAFVQTGVDLQAGGGGRGGDQADDRLVAGQRPPAPVDADLAEQLVLDPVPLAGTGRVIRSF